MENVLDTIRVIFGCTSYVVRFCKGGNHIGLPYAICDATIGVEEKGYFAVWCLRNYFQQKLLH